MPRTWIPFFLLLLAACSEPTLRTVQEKEPEPVPEEITEVVDSIPQPAPVDTPAVVQSTTKKRSPPAEEENLGCSEYVSGGSTGMRSVRYLKPAELAAHPEKITDELPSLWYMAEQGAPVSIADDFERGISTEHRHMPDTLNVEVWIYAKCSDRKPYMVQHYGVWRTAEGGYAWRLR